MSYHFTIKEWDSEFFGYPVASIEGDGDMRDFKKLIDQLQSDHIKLAYWFFNHNADQKKKIAANFNGIVLHNRLTHQFLIANNAVPEIKSEQIRLLDKENEDLLQLIFDCGQFSRFKTDPNFGEELYEKLYRHWISQMLEHHIVFGFFIEEKINGVAVVELKNEIAAFHFLAVSASKRNTGIGKQLTRAVIQTAAANKCKSIIAFTHRMNTPIWKLLEAEGFQCINEESVYHFWL